MLDTDLWLRTATFVNLKRQAFLKNEFKWGIDSAGTDSDLVTLALLLETVQKTQPYNLLTWKTQGSALVYVSHPVTEQKSYWGSLCVCPDGFKTTTVFSQDLFRRICSRLSSPTISVCIYKLKGNSSCWRMMENTCRDTSNRSLAGVSRTWNLLKLFNERFSYVVVRWGSLYCLLSLIKVLYTAHGLVWFHPPPALHP